jgi:hypothetical protein
MTRYWIFDRNDTPQGLPLTKLVKTLRQIVNSEDDRLAIRRSHGYGSTVCLWDDLLDETDQIQVSFEDFGKLVAGGEEWFYDLEARCEMPTGEIVFGIHDSTALFVDAPAGIAEKVAEEFIDARVQ